MMEVLSKLPSSTTDDELDRLLPWNQGKIIPVQFVERIRIPRLTKREMIPKSRNICQREMRWQRGKLHL